MSRHPAPHGFVRHPIPPQKAVVVFISTSLASKQHHQFSPDAANQTSVLGFRGHWIPLQPYRLCRPNLLRLWCPLMCPQRHLCASPRSNRDVSWFKEWCHQLKLTFFRYHPKASRVLIINGHSIKFFFIVEFSQNSPRNNQTQITIALLLVLSFKPLQNCMRCDQNGGLWHSFCVVQIKKFRAIPTSMEMFNFRLDGALSNLC